MGAKMSRIAPVFPVRSVVSALEHYRALGFQAQAYSEVAADGPIYGFVDRDGIEIHLARVPDLDPGTNTSAAYLYVDDADELRARWAAAGVPGRLTEPESTPYGLREFAHVDPDGNLLRVGSEIEGPPSGTFGGS
jgi:predicted enzyme related to lactoylglutathione lyase